ncbi:TetR/AcrR family transcriptional regulator [Xylophilus sp.]|uniref:TetR/AcrR family transcriptional regulator n=1 Tax=Xylophilus sp. TaxID=2653893 RepID=UPI0013BA72FF|nr:TetR/AcrR family transcriptional regulator [Xylophilus sp.]KAF1047830.1 MAG: HTH-type transcriptional regulator BetI [Xylophilus sp.]
MGRKQTIDRGALLDAADRVVLREGTTGLTIDAIAAEAGISKGGVLYAFGTKDGVIRAMFERSTAAYDEHAAAARERHADTPEKPALVHVEATRAEEAANTARAMALLAGLARAPGYREEIRSMYRDIFAPCLQAATTKERRGRIAMLAAEGLFMLRGFGLLDVSDQQWDEIFDDIRTVVFSSPVDPS